MHSPVACLLICQLTLTSSVLSENSMACSVLHVYSNWHRIGICVWWTGKYLPYLLAKYNVHVFVVVFKVFYQCSLSNLFLALFSSTVLLIYIMPHLMRACSTKPSFW